MKKLKRMNWKRIMKMLILITMMMNPVRIANLIWMQLTKVNIHQKLKITSTNPKLYTNKQ
jgi:hypothetical protein